jgi:hypothetical protein
MPSPLTSTKIASIRATLDAGYNGAETAAIEAVSTAVVSQIRRNIYRPAAYKRQSKVANIRLLLLDRFAGVDIARMTQVSQSYVSKIKRQMKENGELDG